MPSSTTLAKDQVWCLDPGPLRPLVEQFTSHLASLGHTALTVRGYGDAARHFAVWLHRSGVAIQSTETYLRADPTEKLEALTTMTPLGLRRRKFQVPDKLMTMLRAAGRS